MKNSALSFYTYCHTRRRFIYRRKKFFGTPMTQKWFLLLAKRSLKAKSRMSRSKRKEIFRSSMEVARWIQRIENVQLPPHGMFWNKFSHSSVGRRVGRGREVVVQSNGPLLAILWPLPPRVDRCRRVVAIRDDILLRLEQRMGTPRRPNVGKFHYALQSV